MTSLISLNKQEELLQQLLLDVARDAHRPEGVKVPQLRFTGGWVRDKLLKSTSPDIDIGIDNMTGFEFGNLMKHFLERDDIRAKYPPDVAGSLAKISANPEKSKHLETATIKVLGLDIDLVNLRKETYSEVSRNPVMEFGSPEEDALRRDATVNALFYNLQTGQVEDFTGRGLEDLDGQVIKTPLPPLQTFKDDPLRVLRAIRFASRLGFKIADEDKAAMSESGIRLALRAKISRERVGIEVFKMLKGPSPHIALSLLDQIGLYGTVFNENPEVEFSNDAIGNWSRAYDSMSDLDAGKPAQDPAPPSTLKQVQRLLLRDSHDRFLAWTLTCFVPLARQPSRQCTAKKPLAAAMMAAKEGLKADNQICKVIADACKHLEAIIALKNDVVAEARHKKPTQVIEQRGVSRDTIGMAIREWGGHWRSSVVFALLTEVLESSSPEDKWVLIEEYANWLEEVERLGLLDVDKLTPLVNGKHLATAMDGVKAGPWTKKALDIAMAWQLRHPEATKPDEGINEVLSRKAELGLST